MKKIFSIYKKDLRDIMKNPALLIVISGLAILPSLYAWFNIKASWDPYGNTGNISVAIVNNDKGTKLSDKNINIGNDVVENLKKNDSLKWNFVNEKTAREGVEKGTYYAFIEIPENFSKNLTSVLDSKVKKGELIYTVNEKINAIAPKITDKGASSIQLEVNETVVKTVSETIFDVFNSVGIELENKLPELTKVENSLKEVQSKFKDIDKVINLADEATVKISDLAKELKNDLPEIQKTITNAKNLSSDIKTFVKDTKGSVDEIGPVIKADLEILVQVSKSASDAVSGMIDAVSKGEAVAPEIIDSMQQKISSLYKTSTSLTKFLTKLDNIAPGDKLGDTIAKLEQINSKLSSVNGVLENIKNDIANGQTSSLDSLNSILKVVNDVNDITSNVYNNFDSKIAQPINNIFEGTISVANDVIATLEKAEKKLPEVNDILNTTIEFSAGANDSVKYIKQKMPKAKNIVDDLVVAMNKINNNKEINELIDILENDVLEEAGFLEKPVELKTQKLYPISNYGSAMTPFYTVLSLWVGILLLVSILTTEVHGDYKTYEKYFGRSLIFITITIIQALIVSLGNIYILKVQVTNAGLFIGISVLTSIVFTYIVYSLVSVFGNVGKAMAIVMLVIQVAGSGGTFPIQVTPEFFQRVNPLLPFTHAINALRETVGGVYTPNLVKAIQALMVFLVIFIVLNVSIKGTLDKYTAKFKKLFNSSDLTGH